MRFGQPRLVSSGHWWTRADKVYTTFDLDQGFVESEIKALLKKKTRFQNLSEGYAFLQADYYKGNQYQLSILDLLKELDIAPGYPPWNRSLGELPQDCRNANTEANEAAVMELRRNGPVFQPHEDGVEEWVFPVKEFEERLLSHRRAFLKNCGGRQADPAGWQPRRTLRFERRGSSEKKSLLIFYDKGNSVGPNEALFAEIHVRPVPSAPLPPETPTPASFADPIAMFRLKIHECRGLPWEYSTFAASHTWSPPQSRRYHGPSPLSGEYHCEQSVLDKFKTWTTVSKGETHADALLKELRAVARNHPVSGTLLPEFSDLLDSIDKQPPTSCIRQDMKRQMIGPVRLSWRASKHVDVDPKSLPAPSQAMESAGNFAAVSFPADLVAQYEAIVRHLQASNFSRTREHRFNGLLADWFELNEDTGRVRYGISIILNAVTLATGSVRVTYRFALSTPCLAP